MLRLSCKGAASAGRRGERATGQKTDSPVVDGGAGRELDGPKGQAPRNAPRHPRAHDGAHMTTPSLIQPRVTMSAMAGWLLVMR